ncbi:DsbC family protein [Luteimonas sp. MC1825]|uniref:DsbC family protein n=1 Tax=Luteimonas sp. MC1825 TaxID=2761107 RepID=UPI0016194F57|nr:DsbC family protein [Luteimonas sp. MC1825]MBB6600064.1 DsbC family protein [Luteimonas sp. MC1825]QOC87766.1 DsbC family protein [Luteimonas sp. MC1825]
MKFLLPLMLCAVSLTACAESPAPGSGDAGAAATEAPAAGQVPKVEAGTADERAVAAIQTINPRVRIDHVGAAPLPGFRELIVGGQVIYVSDDGRYLLQGALFDVKEQKDLSQGGLATVRRDLLKTIPAKDRIIFAADKPDYTVAVFTDVECGYCRRLHQDIAEYNKRGISIEYLAFPRMGPASEDFKKMVSVWCAPDRRQALTDAKADKRVPTRDCTNPVAMHYDIGQRVGLTGTPMIVTAEGMQMPGYMPPDALRAALDKLAAEAAGP